MSKNTEKKLSVLLFDLGFTLINFDGDFHKAMRESYTVLADALADQGLSFEKEKFAYKYAEIISEYYRNREIDLIERPVEESLRKTLSQFEINHVTEPELQKALEAMFIFMESWWKIEPDSHNVLSKLKQSGYRLGIISNASNSPDLNRLVDNHDLRKYFEIIVISGEEGIRKPDQRIFLNTLEKMGEKPENAAMIGDTLTADILGANLSGIRSIWITRRAARPENEKAKGVVKPDHSIPDLTSLIKLVEEINQ